MNIVELRNRLQQLSDADFQKFVSDFGGGYQDREAAVRDFVDDPKNERRLCQLLGLTTEAEKTVKAALDAASSAKWSAVMAAIAVAIALIALVVTIWGVPQ